MPSLTVKQWREMGLDRVGATAQLRWDGLELPATGGIESVMLGETKVDLVRSSTGRGGWKRYFCCPSCHQGVGRIYWVSDAWRCRRCTPIGMRAEYDRRGALLASLESVEARLAEARFECFRRPLRERRARLLARIRGMR